MKIFNHNQLLIILKPKYNYPIICRLVIDQLRKNRFKLKQNKLLNNLLKYKVKCYDGAILDRFDVIDYTKTDISLFDNGTKDIEHYIDTFEPIISDNCPYNIYCMNCSHICYCHNSLIELLFYIINNDFDILGDPNFKINFEK